MITTCVGKGVLLAEYSMASFTGHAMPDGALPSAGSGPGQPSDDGMYNRKRNKISSGVFLHSIEMAHFANAVVTVVAFERE